MPCHRSRRRPWLAGLLARLLLPVGFLARADAQTSYLASLEGPPVSVRYAPGSLDRADDVKRRYERLVEQTGKRRWWKQQLLVVELLEADDWRRAGLAEPFGLPAISAEGSLALPAWGTPETVAIWRDLLNRWLPPTPGTPLRGSSEEVASLAAADLVGEVEASRLVLARLGLVGDQPWVDDLLACALTVSALQEYEAIRRSETHHLFTVLAERGETSPDERLQRLRWVAAAERIATETGKLPAKPLLKMATKSKDRLAAETVLERYPWLREWLLVHRSN